MKNEVFHLGSNPEIILSAYILDSYAEMPNTSVRPAILLCPGGAYRVCSDREGEPVAMAFLAEGYHVFILRYSLNAKAAFPQPLQDAEAALGLIRENAVKWRVDSDKIAACGFSAGGHLAAALGVMGAIRPNALILGYPVTLESISTILPALIPGLDKEIDCRTPPAFIFSTCTDELVPVENSLRFADALDKAGVPFEVHIFQNGCHGLSLAKPVTSSGFARFNNPYAAKWFELCINWLKSLGWDFKTDCTIMDSISKSDYTEYGVDIPLGLLWADETCRLIVLEYIPELLNNPSLDAAMGVSLRTINEYGGNLFDKDVFLELDKKLREVPFK